MRLLWHTFTPACHGGETRGGTVTIKVTRRCVRCVVLESQSNSTPNENCVAVQHGYLSGVQGCRGAGLLSYANASSNSQQSSAAKVLFHDLVAAEVRRSAIGCLGLVLAFRFLGNKQLTSFGGKIINC